MQTSVRRSARSKQVRAIQASRHLGVMHRKHTGKVVARQHTSYPVLVMIMLIMGVFLTSWTRVVTADTYDDPIEHSYTVNASVPGPAPTLQPTIGLSQNQKFKAQPITFSGTCEVNTYEVLYRNGVMSGISLCGADSTYTMQTALFLGANELQVQAMSLTDVAGPFSEKVTVLYDPKYTNAEVSVTPKPSSTISVPSASKPAQTTAPAVTVAGDPLLFKTNFRYHGVYVGQASKWNIGLYGGTAPYAISVDWGDGTTELISRPGPEMLRLEHTYNQAGGYRGNYVVKLSATDTNGERAFMQLIAIVNNPPTGAATTTSAPGDSGGIATPEYLQGILRYVWPGYGVALLMLCSFWLGERREYNMLKPRLKKTRHA